MRFIGLRLSSSRAVQALAISFATVSIALQPDADASLGQDSSHPVVRASVPFVPHAGQWDRRAAFAARTFAGTLFVTTDGQLVYRLQGMPATRAANIAASRNVRQRHSRQMPKRTADWVLTETFIDSHRQPMHVVPRNGVRATGHLGHFLGFDERRRQRGVDTFERVNLGEVFPGIDIQLRATGGNVEKIFTVAAGSNPGQIALRIGGATQLELGVEGELIVYIGNRALIYAPPVAFQEDLHGDVHYVPVRYILDGRQYRFAVSDFEPTQPLVIRC